MPTPLFSRRNPGAPPSIDSEARRRLFLAARDLIEANLRRPGPPPGGQERLLYDLGQQLYGPKPDPATSFYHMWQKNIMLRHGQYRLGNHDRPDQNISEYILNVQPVRVLDIIEVMLELWREFCGLGIAPISPEIAKTTIDGALAESDLPYRVIGTIIATDTPVVEPILEPAARALSDLGIGGAAQEFNRALLAQRAGDLKTILIEASSAVESALKWALEEIGTAYDDKAAAGPLIQLLRDANFFDEGGGGAETSGPISTVLQAAPTLGSRLARHGHGSEARPLSAAAATLALNQAAVAILYLVQRSYEVSSGVTETP